MAQLDRIQRHIEAILFASGEPIEAQKLSKILETEEETIHHLINRLKDRYLAEKSAIDILFLDGSYQMSTLPKYSGCIRAALEIERGATLSSAALEVLAVIAYNQPVTRAFVEEVRGVDCSSLIKGLAEKDLIEEAGRLSIPGKPIIYKTTSTFLRSFSIDSLDQLPTLPEEIPNDPDEEPQVEGQIDLFDEGIKT